MGEFGSPAEKEICLDKLSYVWMTKVACLLTNVQ